LHLLSLHKISYDWVMRNRAPNRLVACDPSVIHVVLQSVQRFKQAG